MSQQNDNKKDIARDFEKLIFDVNYKVQDLNLLILRITTEVDDLQNKEFLKDELLETIIQLLKFQNYIDKKRVSLIKVYNLFESVKESKNN